MRRRVLVDECLPVQLHRWLGGCEVRSVQHMGWKGRSDLDLVGLATGGFDVILTSDAAFAAGMDLESKGLALVIISVNERRRVQDLAVVIERAVRTARPGQRLGITGDGPVTPLDPAGR